MIDPTTLRALIREVIAAEVAAVKAGKAPPPAAPAAESAVRIASDADLGAFARQVLALAADPAMRRAIESGRHPFRLAGGPAAGAAPAAPSRAGGGSPRAAAGPARIVEGVVSEKTLVALPRGTTVLHVGPEVAVTPLARDKARNLKITIERIRS